MLLILLKMFHCILLQKAVAMVLFREAIDWILTVQGRYDEALQTVRRKIFKNNK